MQEKQQEQEQKQQLQKQLKQLHQMQMQTMDVVKEEDRGAVKDQEKESVGLVGPSLAAATCVAPAAAVAGPALLDEEQEEREKKGLVQQQEQEQDEGTGQAQHIAHQQQQQPGIAGAHIGTNTKAAAPAGSSQHPRPATAPTAMFDQHQPPSLPNRNLQEWLDRGQRLQLRLQQEEVSVLGRAQALTARQQLVKGIMISLPGEGEGEAAAGGGGGEGSQGSGSRRGSGHKLR
jgi:hypothetical protein